MAKTIVQGFQKLQDNLNITGLQVGTVSVRQRNVREAVEAQMDVSSSFLTGSYKRSTMLAPLGEADVDVFLVMNAKYFKGGPASLLDKVKRALKKEYPKTPSISRNGQAVTITFSDFSVDVVPGFNRQGGGYLIPNSNTGTWLATNPKKHVTVWTDANTKHAGDLVPLIKMIKGWNKKHSGILRSFHLECLVLSILDGVTISNFPSACRYVFDKARTKVKVTLPDPAGYDNRVGGYLTPTQKTNIVSRLDLNPASSDWSAESRRPATVREGFLAQRGA